MSKTATLTEVEAQERLLKIQLKNAQADVATTSRELEEAQLVAVTGGQAVPGRLVDAAQEARQRQVECEGALAAFARGEELGRDMAAKSARTAAEQRVQKAVDAFRQESEALLAALKELMKANATKAEARLIDVLKALGPANTSVLTDQGWLVSQGMQAVRNGTAESVVRQMVMRQLESRADLWLNEVCDDVVAAAKAQPPAWPGA